MFGIVVVTLCLAAASYGALTNLPKLDSKIVGGQITSIHQHPYQISLRLLNSHMCGGSVIDEWTILTACHCVHGTSAEKLSVRAGSSTHGWNGQLVPVSRVIEHPNYNPDTFENDVALVKLVVPLMFNNLVEPVVLAEQGSTVPAGTKAVVTGWGYTSQITELVTQYLRKVELQVINNDKCAANYDDQATVNGGMLCAVSPGRDSCQGDSGGPLVANGKQIGIVSWGFGCADPAFPGVYTRIANYRTWIDSNRT